MPAAGFGSGTGMRECADALRQRPATSRCGRIKAGEDTWERVFSGRSPMPRDKAGGDRLFDAVPTSEP